MDEETRARVEVVRHVHDVLAGPSRPGSPGTGRRAPTPDAPVLPAPGPSDSGRLAGLDVVLARRRSRYDLTRPLPAPLLGRLVGHALGEAAREGGRRPVSPTAGGLATRQADVLALRVPGAAGLWRHEPGQDRLQRVGPVDAEHLAAALDQPPFAGAAAIVALSARLDVGLARYSVRHYRTLHLDAGIALQSLALAATALDLPACPVAGFDDARLDALLGHPSTTLTLALLAVGGPPA